MTLAAVTAREDARDAYCSERYPAFADLPAGARVGTSSPRRRAQLRALRPDLVYDDVRGNVDTRLRKLRDGEYAAIVLAAAGLNRLGARATHTVPFAVDVVTPAVGQGALGIETRAGDGLAGRLDAVVGDPPASLAVRAERAFLRTVHGGCQAPVGCHATWSDGRFRVVGAIAAADGSQVLRAERDAVIGIGDLASARRPSPSRSPATCSPTAAPRCWAAGRSRAACSCCRARRTGPAGSRRRCATRAPRSSRRPTAQRPSRGSAAACPA